MTTLWFFLRQCFCTKKTRFKHWRRLKCKNFSLVSFGKPRDKKAFMLMGKDGLFSMDEFNSDIFGLTRLAEAYRKKDIQLVCLDVDYFAGGRDSYKFAGKHCYKIIEWLWRRDFFDGEKMILLGGSSGACVIGRMLSDSFPLENYADQIIMMAGPAYSIKAIKNPGVVNLIRQRLNPDLNLADWFNPAVAINDLFRGIKAKVMINQYDSFLSPELNMDQLNNLYLTKVCSRGKYHRKVCSGGHGALNADAVYFIVD